MGGLPWRHGVGLWAHYATAVRFKPSFPAALLVVLSIIAASCGVSREFSAYEGIDDAATLSFEGGDSITIPVSDLERIAGQIEDNVAATDLVFTTGVPEGFDLDILSTLIQVEILNKALADEGASLPESDIADARAALDTQIAGIVQQEEDPETAQAIVTEGISEYLDLIAQQTAVQAAYTGLFQSDDGVEVPCSRHILLETEDEADAAIARLADGEDFEELAMELSTGPSGPSGGDLGCSDPAGFVAPFRDAVITATEGEVTAPVETEFGWHVILVYGSETRPADPAIAEQRAFESFTALRDSTQISVAPALGTWDTSGGRVIPPTP